MDGGRSVTLKDLLTLSFWEVLTNSELTDPVLGS